MADSVYIHIPFCKSKCKYCSFVSFTNSEKQDEYVRALIDEIKYYYKGESIKTLYFGGGTPSLLSILNLKRIIKIFDLKQDCEVTIEVNPDDANLEYFKSLTNLGFNRISLGSQSFNNNVLKEIGRRHTSEQVINAIQLAKEAGFKNISLDLIYGLPIADIEEDLKIITTLGVQHISTYGLKIEENSYWGKFPPQNLPDEDKQADMYLKVNEYLEKQDYKRYEISNFSLKGYESKHNLNYWNNAEYYGFGIAAHGYINGIRYSNCCNFEKYIQDSTVHELEHLVTEKEKLEEEIFLGFRKEEGINIAKINKNFNIDFDEKYKSPLKKFIPEFIEKTNNGYKLTLKGVLLSNNILAEFI